MQRIESKQKDNKFKLECASYYMKCQRLNAALKK